MTTASYQIHLALGTLLFWGVACEVLWRIWPRIHPSLLSSNNHSKRIEGLRGLLASAVVIHHSACSLGLSLKGGWGVDSEFLMRMGSEPVRVFFAITGFLFWKKVLRDSQSSPWTFLRRRFARLMPAYYVALLLLFVICAVTAQSSDGLVSPEFSQDIARWLAVGLPFGKFPDLISSPHPWGMQTWQINAGVFWTLRWEWLFYCALALFLVLKTKISTWWLLGSAAFIGVVARILPSELLEFPGVAFIRSAAMYTAGSFGPGMILAKMCSPTDKARDVDSNSPASRKTWGIVFLTQGIISAPFGRYELIYSELTLLLCAVVFLTRIGDRILTSRSLVGIGTISYSVYLFHGMLLTLTRVLKPRLEVVFSEQSLYWVAIAIVFGPILLMVSMLSYRFLERPFLGGRHSSGPKLAHNSTAMDNSRVKITKAA